MDINTNEIDKIVNFCIQENIDLVVIGPEAPLVLGLADRLNENGIKAFGPSAEAAMLEGSKGYMKDLCARHNIPTAAYGRFESGPAKAFIDARGAPIVVKADGLAAGKGVIITTITEAHEAVDSMLTAGDGNGAEIVIEEFLKAWRQVFSRS